MPLPEDWRAFIASLNSRDVEYVVVGAIALAHHGVPRYTGDLDILIRGTEANSRRLVRALQDFGFGALQLQPSDFTTAYQVVQLGQPPYRIDILTSISGLTFEDAWADNTVVEVDGLRMRVIGLEALIRNKRATGRARDRADLEALEAARRSSLG